MKTAILLASLAAFAAAYPASTSFKSHNHAAPTNHPHSDHSGKPSGVMHPSGGPLKHPNHSSKPLGRPRPFGGPRFGKNEGSHVSDHHYGNGKGYGGFSKPHGSGGYGDHSGHGGDKDDFEHGSENEVVPCTKNDTAVPAASTSTPSFEIPNHPSMDITTAAEIPLPTSVFVSSDARSTLTISVTNSRQVAITRSTRASNINADEAFGNAPTSAPAQLNSHHGTHVMSIPTSAPLNPHHGTHVMSIPTWVPLHPHNGTNVVSISTTAPTTALDAAQQAESTRPFIDIDGVPIDDRHPDFDSLTPKHFDENGNPVPRPDKPANSTSTWSNANGPHHSAGSIKPTPPPAKPDDVDEHWFDDLTPKVFDESGHPVNHTKPMNETKPPNLDHLTFEVYDEFGNPSTNHTKPTNLTVPWKPHHPGAPFLNTTMITSTIPVEPTKFTILPVPLSTNSPDVPVLPSATVSMVPSRPLNTSANTVTPNLARISVVPYGEIDVRDPHCETKCDRTYRKCLDENCEAVGMPRVGQDGLLAPCAQVCITHTCLVSPEFACRKLCGYEGQCGGPTPFVPFLLDHKDIVYESLVSQWPEQLTPPKDEAFNEPGFGGSPVA